MIKPVQAFSFRYDADRPLILCAKSSTKKKNPQTGHLHFSLLSDIHVILLLENKTWIQIWSGLFTLIKIVLNFDMWHKKMAITP